MITSNIQNLPRIKMLVLYISLISTFISTKLPPSHAQTDNYEFNYTLVDGYPKGNELFGNIAGIDVDNENIVIIFHRGSHHWTESTFNQDERYVEDRDIPIPEETVVFIDPRTNPMTIKGGWGKNLFFMPHGLSLDIEGKHLWLTDVALHQVFKFTLNGSKLLVTLGERFVPGKDENHFCKPTSVADTGKFIFVADGYCNSRIVMFSVLGKYLGEFGQSSSTYSLNTVQPTFRIPHKIIYAKEAKMICVADRENGRIQCFSFDPKDARPDNNEDTSVILNGSIKPKFIIQNELFNGRLFSIDYNPIKGGIIVAVSGQDVLEGTPPIGFVFNVTTGQMISRFKPPPGKTFGMAHDLVISGRQANHLFVVDITPVNIWKFSRPSPHHTSVTSQILHLNSIMSQNDVAQTIISPFLLIAAFFLILLIFFIKWRSKSWTHQSHVFTAGSTRFNSLYGLRSNRISQSSRGHTNLDTFLVSGLIGRGISRLFNKRRQNDEFRRIPIEESDDSDDDKSGSDVEEFNINQPPSDVRIQV